MTTMSLYLKCLTISLIAVMLSLLLGQPAYGQRANPSRAETAVRRSQNAAKTIKVITGMPKEEAIPADLLNRAQAIAVFPDVVRMTLLLSQGMKGYGVICSRRPDGWSMPAYYGFGSSETKLKLAGFKSFDLIMLFMNENALSWFQKGRIELEGIRAGVAGPIGEGGKGARGFNVIVYALVDGKLRGMDVESTLFDPAAINPDNNINQAVYGIKGREVLEGKTPKLSAPPEVAAFRDILKERFPAVSN
jgi:lipid-binding SYLF domain-containing protein